MLLLLPNSEPVALLPLSILQGFKRLGEPEHLSPPPHRVRPLGRAYVLPPPRDQPSQVGGATLASLCPPATVQALLVPTRQPPGGGPASGAEGPPVNLWCRGSGEPWIQGHPSPRSFPTSRVCTLRPLRISGRDKDKCEYTICRLHTWTYGNIVIDTYVCMCVCFRVWQN